jgi:small subunit ribosomal protein S17
MPKRQVIGVVTSDRMQKTRRVEIGRLVRHRKYGKFMRRRTVCHVHDENNASKLGDTVEIIECPPRSKLKRWELVRVVSESQQVDLAAMRAAQRLQAEEIAIGGRAGQSTNVDVQGLPEEADQR